MFGRSILGSGLLSALVWSSSSAVAAEEEPSPSTADRAQRLYLEGVTLYRDGKYRAAAAQFARAYQLFADPRLIYNIARSYEATGELEEAMRRYRRCIDDPKATPELQQKALRRVRLILRVQQRSAAAPEEPPPSAPVGSVRVPGPDGPSRPGWVHRSKWIAGAAALGLLGGGAALLALGLSDEGRVDEARTADGEVSALTRVQAAELIRQAETKQTAGVVLLSVGAALATVSVVLFAVDGVPSGASAAKPAPDRGPQPRLTFGVAPLAGGGALLLSKRF